VNARGGRRRYRPERRRRRDNPTLAVIGNPRGDRAVNEAARTYLRHLAEPEERRYGAAYWAWLGSRRRRPAPRPQRFGVSNRFAGAIRAVLDVLGGLRFPNPGRALKRRRATAPRPTTRRAASPPRLERLIGRQVEEVRYQHQTDGRYYKHGFGPGVRMYGLSNGQILISHPSKHLWEDR
jgi:hypothetical protein